MFWSWMRLVVYDGMSVCAIHNGIGRCYQDKCSEKVAGQEAKTIHLRVRHHPSRSQQQASRQQTFDSAGCQHRKRHKYRATGSRSQMTRTSATVDVHTMPSREAP